MKKGKKRIEIKVIYFWREGCCGSNGM